MKKKPMTGKEFKKILSQIKDTDLVSFVAEKKITDKLRKELNQEYHTITQEYIITAIQRNNKSNTVICDMKELETGLTKI